MFTIIFSMLSSLGFSADMSLKQVERRSVGRARHLSGSLEKIKRDAEMYQKEIKKEVELLDSINPKSVKIKKMKKLEKDVFKGLETIKRDAKKFISMIKKALKG